MTICCFKEAAHTYAELELQHQEREFMGRVLDHFASTYDIPEWCQNCLPWRTHRPPSREWWKRLLPSPLACCALLQGLFLGATGMWVLQEGPLNVGWVGTVSTAH